MYNRLEGLLVGKLPVGMVTFVEVGGFARLRPTQDEDEGHSLFSAAGLRSMELSIAAREQFQTRGWARIGRELLPACGQPDGREGDAAKQ